MRSCAVERDLPGCEVCRETSCPHRAELLKMQAGGRDAGLFVKTGDRNDSDLFEEWTNSLKETWPSVVLFAAKRGG
jgi:hypothetical protein